MRYLIKIKNHKLVKNDEYILNVSTVPRFSVSYTNDKKKALTFKSNIARIMADLISEKTKYKHEVERCMS